MGRALNLVVALALLAAGAATVWSPAFAQAAGQSCAALGPSGSQPGVSAGHPCWTDTTPYPFGADGNPVDPTNGECGPISPPGPSWSGDFYEDGFNGNPPCYLQVTSLAFRAWNRGIAAAAFPPGSAYGGTNAFGVWLFNGTDWFPDPAFPGSSACPGSQVLWAGKLDYWLIGPSYRSASAGQVLCRFDGVNLVWEPFKLPAATLARLLDSQGVPNGGVTSGACYAWNNCWFFGTDGIVVHWDGQTLSDATPGSASSPWLQGDFTGAVGGTDASGNPFGLAVTDSGTGPGNGSAPGSQLPSQPDGSPPPQVFGSQGGQFAPLSYSPPATPQPGDPYTTDLVAVNADLAGDVWIAADPTGRERPQSAPAPLLRLNENGQPVPCSGYDASTFTFTFNGSGANGSYTWGDLSVLGADGSAFAGAAYFAPGQSQIQPALVRAACGQAPSLTTFAIRQPFGNQSSAPYVPADSGAGVTAVSANAVNDAWAAAGTGFTVDPFGNTDPMRPRLYRLTDGQPPQAPIGDDNESRPSLFTLDAPVFVQAPPVVVSAPVVQTVTQRKKHRTKKLPPAVFGLHSSVVRAAAGNYTLYISFTVRRPITIGIEALRGKDVVATSGLKRFKRGRGQLALTITRTRWPNHLKFVTPRRPRH